MYYILTLLLMNLSYGQMFDNTSVNYDTTVSIDIVGDLDKAYNAHKPYAADAKPVKGFLIFHEPTIKIPTVLLCRGGIYPTNLRFLIPADKNLLLNTPLSNVDFSTISKLELSSDKYHGLSDNIDTVSKNIFYDKDGEIPFLKMVNRRTRHDDKIWQQTTMLREYYTYKIYEKVFSPIRHYKVKLAKINYYDVSISNYLDELTLEDSKIYQNTQKGQYGFFIEPKKSMLKRAKVKSFDAEEVANWCKAKSQKTYSCIFGRIKEIGYNIDLDSFVSFLLFNNWFGGKDWSIPGWNITAVTSSDKTLYFIPYDFDETTYNLDVALAKPFDSSYLYDDDGALRIYMKTYKIEKKDICIAIKKVLENARSKWFELAPIVDQYNAATETLGKDSIQKCARYNDCNSLDLAKIIADSLGVITTWDVSNCYSAQ